MIYKMRLVGLNCKLSARVTIATFFPLLSRGSCEMSYGAESDTPSVLVMGEVLDGI